MIDDFDKLRTLGAQKIHEATHISRSHVQSVLQGDFEGMTKIQLMGFISIFEREYHMDLEGLRQRVVEYFGENEEDIKISATTTKVFQNPRKKRKFTLVYIAIATVIFLAFMFVDTSSDVEESTKVIVIDNSAIESAKSNIIVTVENNETNVTKEEIVVKKINKVSSFVIQPKVKVWLGYVDLSTHKKYQKTFKDDLELDSSKDWLLAFGHGHIDIDIDGEVKKYVIKTNVRFSYIDGELKQINFAEFKRLNKGSKW